MNLFQSATHPAFQSKTQQQHFVGEVLKILQQINKGLHLEEILQSVFDNFSGLVPYDRIGFSLIDNRTYSAEAFWLRTRYSDIKLSKGYSAPLKGSSLERVILSGQPRIINNLEKYLADHPQSESSRLIFEEGIRSSLTCPVVHGDTPVGFIFFSSKTPEAYKTQHVEAFQWITEPLALALERARIYEKLLKLNQEKNLLLGVAAHDLRSPIAQIQTMGELLKTDNLPETDRKELAELLVSRCQGMLTLLHDLLDLSAIEAGRLPLRIEKIRILPFCQSILKGLSPLARAKKITLKTDGDDQMDVKVDASRFSQALDNLVTNAIKYSPEGASVCVGVAAMVGGWQLTVTDEGKGIASTDIPKLFKPFGRTQTTPTAGEEQFGLGLAIVKKIVEAHGGEISVQSQLCKGTTFTIRIPTFGN